MTFLNKIKLNKWQAISLLTLIAISVVMILLKQTTTNEIPVVSVKQGEFIIDTKVSGEIQAVNSENIRVPRHLHFNLRIVNLVSDGAIVKKGDFLVQFDPNDVLQTVAQKEQELENARAELEVLKANIATEFASLETSLKTQQYSFEQAKLRHQLMKFEAKAKQREQEINFKKEELALEQASQKIETQKIINQSKIKKAELKIEQAEMQLERQKQNSADLTITSPGDGLVVLKETYGQNGPAKIKIGDTPWPGMDILEIPDLSQMKVMAQLNEMNISRVSVGQKVLIEIDALPGKKFYGMVSYVAALAKRKRGSNIKVFDIEILIDKSGEQLRPGMTAQCRIITEQIKDKMYIPLESVFFKNDTTIVYTKKGDFRECPVKTGVQNDNYVVIEQGLNPDDEIALYDPTIPLEELNPEDEKKETKLPL